MGERLPYKQDVIGSSPIIPIRLGGIAQLARACGSYPQCPGFKSLFRYKKPGKPMFSGPLIYGKYNDLGHFWDKNF